MKIGSDSKYYFLVLFFTGLTFFSKSQTDTSEIVKIIELARADFSSNPRKSISLSEKVIKLAGNDKKFVSKAYNTIGSAYYFLGIYDSSEIHHRRALQLQRELNDVEGLGRSYTNIGTVYSDQGFNDKAITYFLIAEKKFNLIGYRLGQAKLNNSLGILFYNIKDYSNAIKYFKAGLKIAAGFSDQTLYYSISINLANALGDAGQMDEALLLYKQSYAHAKAENNYLNLIVICNNICQSYLGLDSTKKHFTDSARKYGKEALQLITNPELPSQYKMLALSNHASILYKEQKYKEAIPFLDTAIYMATEFDDLQKQIGFYDQLSMAYHKSGNLPLALLNLRAAVNLKDTLYAQKLREKISEINAVHNVTKKEAEISILNSEKRNQKKVNILLIVIISISVVSLIVTIYNYLRKQKDNKLISAQKKEVESKNTIIEHKQHEIIDSINYAKRLQEAILPPENYFKTHLPSSFILYQPKDIVAGDFYWMETLPSQAGEKLVLFAVADCTGHGVPGAMVSVVCSNALNRSVLEFRLTDPGEILNKTRELVIATFQKSSMEIKDGMDISFCCLNLNTLELKWAGANNPLWLIQDNIFIEIKADKQPIGKYFSEKPFTTHQLQLKKGDQLYLLTDGFADQFGGPEGKKFKYKPLKEKLLEAHSESPEAQYHLLLETFIHWKKDLTQVDDVCIIGIRL